MTPPERRSEKSSATAAADRLAKDKPATGLWSKRGAWLAAVGAGTIVLLIGFGLSVLGGAWPFPLAHDRGATAGTPTFVGSETCAGCHKPEAGLWRTSQHNHAMAHATEQTVLGDFSNTSFDHFGVTSRFFRDGDKFVVETDGPDGKLAIFEVKYTFGIEPLQQYLTEFPDGRVQALPMAWDTRAKDKGGQRWFHLYPNEQIKHNDVLHWTRLNQNWNFMCAECHSTGVRKNYDAANDRYATTFAEISVGCEACHGKGSPHVAWARDQQSWHSFGRSDDLTKGLSERFSERRDGKWSMNPATGNAIRSSAPRALRAEVETCGLCHARRAEFSEDWAPGQSLSETHVVSTVARGLYEADGQMLDEVYNYGSFKQSKMFAAGVTCSDCHEPHGAKLRAPDGGVCLQCHSGEKYAAASHHHHEAASPQLSCVSCHMPLRFYMVVDRRHDHSFRIPRPDVSAKLGTPNACNDCHADKNAQWAASAVAAWYGPKRPGFQNYAEAFHAALTGGADAATLLAAVAADGNAPAFARASALTELRGFVSPANVNLARAALVDPDPLVRIGALDMLDGLPPQQVWPLVSPLLSDSNRGVRIRAVSLLAAVPDATQPAADRNRFDRAAVEFVAAQELNADRPEARTTLGSFYARRGNASAAESEFKTALRLSPQFAPAAINLADLYRGSRRDGDGEAVLRTAISASPRDAGLFYALGLNLTRLQRTDEAIAELRRAAELEPSQARYTYVYAVALHSAGRHEATSVLKDGLKSHPNDRDFLQALATFSRDSGDFSAALAYAERLAQLEPGDPNIAGLIRSLRSQVNQSDVK